LLSRFALAILLLASPLAAQRIQLFLKGGGEIIVREYEVQADRVRYYSVERSAWEEIPTELIDLEKTQKTVDRKEARLESMRAESARERAAERKGRSELQNVPIDEGVYFYLEGEATLVEQSEVITDKSAKRGLLKIISPLPIVAGKNLLLVEGAEARFATSERKPVFFVRQSRLAQFGIVKLEPAKKDHRLVQVVQVHPVSKEIFEEFEEVEVFRQQLASGVYRVWPINDLEPGEYAIIDFAPGEFDLRVWDFSVVDQAPAGAAASP
jgi:hypothetical protein